MNEVLQLIQSSYDSLYCKTGVAPNAVMLSVDMIDAVTPSRDIICYVSPEELGMRD